MSRIILETRCQCRRVIDVHHTDYEAGRTMIECPGMMPQVESVHIPHVMVSARAFYFRGRIDPDFCLRVFEEEA